MRLNYWTTNNFFEILKNNLWSNNFCQEIQKNVWNWCCIISCRVYSEWTWVLPCNLNCPCLLFKVFTLIEIPWYFTKTQMMVKILFWSNALWQISHLLNYLPLFSVSLFLIIQFSSTLMTEIQTEYSFTCFSQKLTPLTVIQMVTLWGDMTFLIVLWFQTRYMKDLPKYCGAVVKNTVCYYE